ncbi:MAG TPA: TlpA disulfide reductase family protein [Fibrobacteria bacterium]|nr:TlpA disulfide reductase family protein [Fibrobacteria bacterium]
MRHVILVLLLATGVFAEGLKVVPGQTAPRFSLVRLDSAQRRVNLRDFADSARHALHRDFGRPVVLSFWSTTCVNCKAEFPRLQRWATAHPSVLFLPVLVEDDDPSQGIQWLRSAGVKASGLLDRYQVVGKSYGVCEGEICTVPDLVAIGPDQQVKLARQGYHPELPLEADLDKALSLGSP